MRRRSFLASTAAAAATASVSTAQDPAAPKPNILWLTCEDTGPQLGCYGDAYAVTPNLDALAGRALRYLHAWSNAPVCAPARTTIISGLYPPSTGAEHMRSMTKLPAHMKMFPCYLREAGYYCTNNSKEDYNLEHTGKVWDDSSNKAHYKNRAAGQPFFAVFNNVISHESQIRTRPHKQVSDPAKARIPAYHPDTPEVRQDWAQYYDNIRTVDSWVGKHLQDLADAGLTDSTIVFFYGDHGSGMPRSKRWPYNSGLHVPLLVHIPEKFRHLWPAKYNSGSTSERPVSFVDLAPTVLSLAGLAPQAWHQGHAFLGPHASAAPQRFIYGFRGRMDERYDMVRSVRDRRYVYIRNFMPHRIYGQHVAYMFETPTTRVWKKLNDEGRLNEAQRAFWNTKPAEELYDLKADRDEVHNLVNSPAHRAALERMRKAQRELAMKIRDVGYLPEGEIHARAAGAAPYDMGHDAARYPAARVMDAAEMASAGGRPSLLDPEPAVRYWAAQGYLVRREADDALRAALKDSSPYVRAVAAEGLVRYGNAADAAPALAVLLDLASADRHGVFIALLALTGLDAADAKAAPVKEEISRLPREAGQANARFKSYIPRLIEKTMADL